MYPDRKHVGRANAHSCLVGIKVFCLNRGASSVERHRWLASDLIVESIISNVLDVSRRGDGVVRLGQPLRGAVALWQVSRGRHVLLRHGGEIRRAV